jgi:citrate lyase beta subunit
MTKNNSLRPDLYELAADLDELLAVSDAELATGYARDSGYHSQPVHTAYVPAHTFGQDTVRRWGSEAIASLEEFAPGPADFADAFGVGAELAGPVRSLVLAKLAAEPIEDLRIDFEDGYGTRSDDTEDAHARAAARALRAAHIDGTSPPSAGIRCKSLEPATRRRAIRTIDLFLSSLAEPGAELPGVIITLPKVTSAAQVTAMNVLCQRLEPAYGLVHPRRLRFEIQVELPRVILGADGVATIANCVRAGRGRLTGLHFGTYDYAAAIGVSAAYQSLDHPAADYAKAVMQVAAAGTGVDVSDGSTNVLPVGSRDEVIAAWRLHARLVRRSLERGFYQGWDLHPAQLVSRYAATFAFYTEGLASAGDRLRAYEQRARAGLEEPATGKALAAFLCRGLDCGAFSQADITGLTGLDLVDLRAIRRRGIRP